MIAYFFVRILKIKFTLQFLQTEKRTENADF